MFYGMCNGLRYIKAWHELYPKGTMPSEAEIEAFLSKKAALLRQEMLNRSKNS
ncbi:MAG: hypothetical protein V3576_04920 [Candidatus Cloacimonadota bacterium]